MMMTAALPFPKRLIPVQVGVGSPSYALNSSEGQTFILFNKIQSCSTAFVGGNWGETAFQQVFGPRSPAVLSQSLAHPNSHLNQHQAYPGGSNGEAFY